SETDIPVMITQNEFMRRFQDMQKLSGQSGYGNFEHYNLVVNANHPIIGRIIGEADDTKRQDIVKQLVDLALLSQNMLTGERLSQFVKRSVELI
ncbi:MAG: molecular chaperone HtpG, partial [Bacteroidales bacterium]|nr:molecular chaperone HtpG [Bacteroidales bacterium]